MAEQGGISGVAVGMATAGAFLLYVGINDTSIRDGLKSVAGGKLPARKTGGGQAVAKAEVSLSGQGVPSAGGAPGPVGRGPHPELAQAAQRYLGVQYLWGGTSAKGMDCSGLTYLSFYDAYGVKPPRTTYTLVAWRALTPVAREDVGAGDLLFWPKVGPPSHVGIAMDNEHVIHAPRPGKVVQVVPISQAFTGGLAPTCFRYTGKV